MENERKEFGRRSPVLIERTEILEKYNKGQLHKRTENRWRVCAGPLVTTVIAICAGTVFMLSPETRAFASEMLEFGREWILRGMQTD